MVQNNHNHETNGYRTCHACLDLQAGKEYFVPLSPCSVLPHEVCNSPSSVFTTTTLSTLNWEEGTGVEKGRSGTLKKCLFGKNNVSTALSKIVEPSFLAQNNHGYKAKFWLRIIIAVTRAKFWLRITVVIIPNFGSK